MADALALFDQAALKKRISETVQSTFGSLIPDAAFEQMVKNEITAFFEAKSVNVEVKKNQDYYGRTAYNTEVKEQITPFAQMVRAAFNEKVLKEVTDAMCGEEFSQQGYIRDGMSTPSSFAQRVLSELTPQIAGLLFGGVVDNLIQKMRSELSR